MLSSVILIPSKPIAIKEHGYILISSDINIENLPDSQPSKNIEDTSVNVARPDAMQLSNPILNLCS